MGLFGERGGTLTLDPMIKSQWNPEIQGKNIEGQLENQRKTLEALGRK